MCNNIISLFFHVWVPVIDLGDLCAVYGSCLEHGSAPDIRAFWVVSQCMKIYTSVSVSLLSLTPHPLSSLHVSPSL